MTKIVDAELIDLVAEGATVPEMAGILGVTQPAITYRLGKLGLQAAPAIATAMPATAPTKRPRRAASTRFSKPASSRRKVRRLCMTCLEPFTSDGPHNRVCTACRHATEVTIYSLGASKK